MARSDPKQGVRLLSLGGDVLEVRVRESARARRLRITVGPDQPAELVVPRGTGEGEIDRMLRTHRRWIRAKSAELRAAEARRPRLGLDRPGVVWLHGEPLPVSRGGGMRSVASLRGSRLAVSGPGSEAAGAVDRWYRREARRRIERAVAAEGAELGLRPARVAIRDQRTRWGSCSPQGTLSFSWRLLLAPYPVLDYVVVHELCHLRRLDHSHRFWALVEAARPDWQAQSRWLREHGVELGRYSPDLAFEGLPE